MDNSKDKKIHSAKFILFCTGKPLSNTFNYVVTEIDSDTVHARNIDTGEQYTWDLDTFAKINGFQNGGTDK